MRNTVIFVLVATGIAACAPADTLGTHVEAVSTVPGCDVSNYQGNINWGSVAAQGARFAYAKTSEGLTYLDPYWNANYSGAKNAGLYAGGYHYGRPDRSGGRA